MKQFLRSLCTLLMLVVWASGFAAEKTYSYTFGKATKADFTSQNQTKKLGGIDWTLASDAKTVITNANPSGQQIGSNNNPVKNATISTTAIPGTIKSITVTAKAASNDAKMSLSVLVNNVQYGNKIDLSTDESNYEFKNNNNLQSGKIEIKFINSASKGGFYIKNITVNYEEGPSKIATTLTFPQPAINIEGGNEASFKGQTATLKAGETVLDKAIAYTKSGDDIFATFDATTGAATLKSGVYGSATITATFAGDDTYEKSTDSYKLTIVDPNADGVTFDFSNPAKYGKDVPATNNETVIGVGNSIVSGIVSLTVTKDNSKTKSRFWNSGGEITYRLYEGAINTVSVPDGYVITAISITASDKKRLFNIGENTDNSDWTGSAQSVQITATGSAVLETMTVAYSKLSTLTLDEAADDTDTKIANNNGKTVDVTLTRTLTAGAWNTICLPFDVTVEQMEDVLKSTVSVKEYGDENADTQTIYFNDATTMVAGKPYLIKLPEGTTIPTELVFKGVTIKNVGESDRKFGSNYKICGTFGKYTMKTDGTELFLKTDGKFYVPAVGTATMKGFRAYFFVPKNTAGAALNLSFGEATGIDGVAADAEKNVKVYNVNGQYVGTSLDALPKGLYIVGGKKVLK